MTFATLILRSLRFHARANLGVLLGATVGSAVLIGALLVGDSVRESLREMALTRLGRVDFALAANDRMFRQQLAADLAPALKDDSGKTPLTAAALQLQGTAAGTDGSSRANRVQVLGVDESFWKLANQKPDVTQLSADDVALNEPLARQLNVKSGDTVILRVPKPSRLSRDAPLSTHDDSSVALRLKVRAILRDEQMGRWSLQANQIAPFNAFVGLRPLQEKIQATNQANLLLVAHDSTEPLDRQSMSTLHSDLESALKSKWRLTDAELELHPVANGTQLELRTPRVFLDPPAVQAVQSKFTAQPLGTYFVNELRVNDHATPYSMVTAAGAPFTPEGLRDDEIVINQWLADDLKAGVGDKLSLRYFTVSLGRSLEERTNTFRVHSIVPMQTPFADRSLMPDFPGVAQAESTSEWDGSLPIDASRIRPTDEKYWKDWRGTPKAFVSLNAGSQMWSNRFGTFTAVRVPVPAGTDATAFSNTVATTLTSTLNPATFALQFEPVRAEALSAVAQAQDFGGLFIGFSFFLITAALLLTAMLFQFGIEQRAVETGVLLALGLTPRQVRRLFLLEGAALASLGSLLGLVGGIAYARAMVHGLTTVWRGAVGTSSLSFHATSTTMIIGVVAGMFVGIFTVWLAVRRQINRPARELLSEGAGEEGSMMVRQRRSRAPWVAGISLGLALATIGWGFTQEASAEAFFSAGGLLLVAGLAAIAALLSRLERSATASGLTLAAMGLRNATRRRRRSLATVAMLACGSFLIVAIGAFRLDENQQATKRSSGTGGFAFIGESTLAVHHDLNEKSGRDFYSLDATAMKDVSIVPCRVRDGDDASCLNLNRAQKPRLLGVKPELFASRDAFSFAALADGVAKDKPWLALKTTGGNTSGPVPAIADQNSILWALGKKVGDTLDYTDERGNTFQVRLVGGLANSILQGNIIIDETEFARRFPGEGGYRMFLVDAPAAQATNVSAKLTRALQDVGLELTPATQRLAAFNAVQNTYLSTFQVLGGLGLLLGSVGLGVVVLRNVLERRSELALLLAVGFVPRSVKWLVASEHGALLLLGLALGVLAAVIAVLPTVLAPGNEVPVGELALTLGLVLASGGAWTWVATLTALRGRLVAALRNE